MDKRKQVLHTLIGLASLVALVLGLAAVFQSPLAPAAAQRPAAAAQVVLPGGLIFLQTDAASGTSAIAHRPAGSLEALATGETTVLASSPLSEQCELAGLSASPRGNWLATPVSCEGGGFVLAVNPATG